MSEAATLQAIRIDLGRVPGVRLFRNNVGLLRDHRGQAVRFGLHPGSGDLIGWRTVTVTPDMVGRSVAVIASVEVKSTTGRPRDDQVHWADTVRAAGGFAGIARSPEQARLILGLPT
jgi:hypothetical protein